MRNFELVHADTGASDATQEKFEMFHFCYCLVSQKTFTFRSHSLLSVYIAHNALL